MLAAVRETSSITIQVGVALFAAAAVWIKSRGRETWRRQTDRRRHPARVARFAGAAAAVVAGAVLVTRHGRDHESPASRSARRSGRGARPDVGTGGSSVPGLRERPAPLSYSGASY